MSKNTTTAAVMGEQLAGMLRDEAAKFVKSQSGPNGAGQKLGEAVVRAIFAQEFEASFPGIPDVGEGVGLEILAAVEEVNAARSEIFQLVAKAEKEHAELVAAVRASAVNTLVNIAKGLVGIVGGFSAGIIKG